MKVCHVIYILILEISHSIGFYWFIHLVYYPKLNLASFSNPATTLKLREAMLKACEKIVY